MYQLSPGPTETPSLHVSVASEGTLELMSYPFTVRTLADTSFGQRQRDAMSFRVSAS